MKTYLYTPIMIVALFLLPMIAFSQAPDNGLKDKSEKVSPTLTDGDIIRFDNGVNQNAIGSSGTEIYTAAYFPNNIMGQFAGMELVQVEIYIAANPTSAVLTIYGPGSATQPGAVLHTQPIITKANSWIMIGLTTPVCITGEDLWISYKAEHNPGDTPAGVDAGPAMNGYGDMMSEDGITWVSMYNANGTDCNWNIAGYLEEPFLCGSTMFDAQGNEYNTVQIGEQCWMSENLAYLPEVSPSNVGSPTDPYFYVSGYEGTNVEDAKATGNYQNYGVLYNWPAAMTACPDGWYLPADDDWNQLIIYHDPLADPNAVGLQSYMAGGMMKSTRTEPDPHPRWNLPNTGATNEYGFAAIPGGNRSNFNYFYGFGAYAQYWSSAMYSASRAWYRHLFYNSAEANRSYILKDVGFSVRCFRNTTQPNVIAGADATICEGSNYQLNARASNYSSALWTSNGEGTIINAGSLNAEYIPHPLDYGNMVTLCIEVQPINSCYEPETDCMDLLIQAKPVIVAGENATISQGLNYYLSAAGENYSSVLWSTPNGNGTFNPPDELYSVYNTDADQCGSTIILCITAEPINPCDESVTDCMELYIQCDPVVYAGADVALCCCEHVYCILDALEENCSSVYWSTSGSGYFDDDYALNPCYTPSVEDCEQDSIVLYLHGVGIDPNTTVVIDSMTIYFDCVWIKDCDADNARVPSNCNPFWASADIWVDNDNNDTQDKLEPGTENNVFVRVRNRTPFEVNDATVELYYATAFVFDFPDGTQINGTYTVPSIDPLSYQDIEVKWDVPNFSGDIRNYSIGAVLDHPCDHFKPISVTANVRGDNNKAMLNIYYLYLREGTSTPKSRAGEIEPAIAWFLIGNPSEETGQFIIDAETDAPPGWTFEFFDADEQPVVLPYEVGLAAMEEQNMKIMVTPDEDAQHGDEGLAIVSQYEADGYHDPEAIIGGISFPVRVDLFAPAAITDLEAEISGERIELQWTPVTLDVEGNEENIACYNIYRGDNPGFEPAEENRVGRVAVDQNDEKPGFQWYDEDFGKTTLYYLARLEDEAGYESENSNLASVVLFSVTATATPEHTCEGEPVELNAEVTEGSGTYTYSWTSDPPGWTSQIKNPVVYPEQDITYTVEVTDGGITLSASVSVDVQLNPVAYAGPDGTTCCGMQYLIEGAEAYHYAELQWWTTNGTGSFDDPNALNPVYTPTPYDCAQGAIELWLKAEPWDPCTLNAEDFMILTLQNLPDAYAGPDMTVCGIAPVTISGANPSSYDDLQWYTLNGTGIINPEDVENPTYTPTLIDLEQDSIILCLDAYPLYPCDELDTDSMTIYFDCVWIKDCEADDAREPSNCIPNFWASYDIWVDNEPDPDGILDKLVEGTENNVFVRVRNRTSNIVENATLNLYYAELPIFDFPNGTQINGTYNVPPIAPLCHQDVNVVWDVPEFSGNIENYSIGAVFDHQYDQFMPPDNNVRFDNNKAMLNIHILYLRGGGKTTKGRSGDIEPAIAWFLVGNPSDEPGLFIIDAETDAPAGWTFEFFDANELPVNLPYEVSLEAQEEQNMKIMITPDENAQHGDEGLAIVSQYEADGYPNPEAIIGGISFPVRVDLFPPEAITDLEAGISGEAIELQWTPVTLDVEGNEENIACYNIYRGDNPDFEPAEENRVGRVAVDQNNEKPGFQWYDEDFGKTTLYYLARVEDEAGYESENSNLASVILFSVTATAVPEHTCEGDPVQLEAGVTGGSGTYTYLWTSDPPGFTSDQKNPVDNSVQDITYTVEVTDGGITLSASVSVDVQLLPVVDAGPNGTVCENESYTVTGATIIGDYEEITWVGGEGLWISQGTLQPEYTPSQQDISNGQVDLIIVVMPKSPCTLLIFDMMTLQIIPAPEVNCPQNLEFCINDPLYELSGATPAGGTYSGPGVITSPPGVFFDPATAGPGTHTIQYECPEINGCTNTCNFTITVVPLPEAYAGADATIVPGDNYHIADASASNYADLMWTVVTGSGTIVLPTNLNPTYQSAPGDCEVVELRLTAEPLDPCMLSAEDDMNLTVMILPEASQPSGSGTSSNPYLIATLENLYWISEQASNGETFEGVYFKQTADIDASDTEDWFCGLGWNPIGGSFYGNYNGDCHAITSLYINRPDEDYIGLFGTVRSGARVEKIRLVTFYITGNGYVGALAGQVRNDAEVECVDVENVQVHLSDLYGGGLTGLNYNSARIYRCSASGQITRGNASSYNYVGGFVGGVGESAIVEECYSTTEVTSLNHRTIGGFVGLVGTGGEIINSYSRGPVTASGQRVGGFVGHFGEGSVTNCFSTGLVTAPYNYVGGFAGYLTTGVCNNNFWDITTSNQPTSPCATGETTAGMKTMSTFTSAGWDFENVWDMDGFTNDGYPALKWQLQPVADAGPSATMSEGLNYTLTAVAENYSSVSWSTPNGYGNFSPLNDLTTTYTPDQNDYGKTITLCITAEPIDCCEEPVTDCMELYIQCDPTVYAGADVALCGCEHIYCILDALAENCSLVYWSTSGSGYFDDDYALNPCYTPSAEDCLQDSIVLYLTGVGIPPNGTEVIDSMTIYFDCVWIKDCEADDAREPSNCNPFWASYDIWVDNQPDGKQDMLVKGTENNVFVRVRNRTPYVVNGATVDLYYGMSCFNVPCGTQINGISYNATPIYPLDSLDVLVKWDVPELSGNILNYFIGAVLDHPEDPYTNNVIKFDNNKAMLRTWYLYLREGQPTPKGGSGNIEPAIAWFPIGNPSDEPGLFIIDSDTDAPAGWTFEFFDADEQPVVLPYEVSLEALEEQNMKIMVTPDENAQHGNEGLVVVKQYEAADYPDPGAVIGGINFPLRVDLYPPEAITDLEAEVSDETIELQWTPVTLDVEGNEENTACYNIYRGDSANFVPAEENRVGRVAVDQNDEKPGFQWYDEDYSKTTLYYLARVEDEAGYESDISNIVAPPCFTVTATATPQSVCEGDPVQLDAIVTGGSGACSYNWYSDPPGWTSQIKNPVVYPEQNIIYIVEVIDCFMYATSSVNVAVQPLPTAYAGIDVTISSGQACYSLSIAMAENYESLEWTAGDGEFNQNQYELNPTYCFGPGDISNGSVTLCLTAYGIEPCFESSTSCMAIYLYPMDFGDAPDLPYPTLFDYDGARHRIIEGVHLGYEIDGETDGQPSPDAFGDEWDEDGIIFMNGPISPVLYQGINTIQVIASVEGYLDAWIDFNNDGLWNDSNEHVLTNYVVGEGSNYIDIYVDVSYDYEAYSRFRFRTSSDEISYFGYASDGEVEDYLVHFLPEIQIISDSIDVILPVYPGDLGGGIVYVQGGTGPYIYSLAADPQSIPDPYFAVPGENDTTLIGHDCCDDGPCTGENQVCGYYGVTYCRCYVNVIGENPMVFISLPAYTYYIEVIDANGLMVTDTFTITDPFAPHVFAGNDATICDDEAYTLMDATASNYSALQWSSSGTGFFGDETLLNPTYYPGTEDISNGHAELCLTGYPLEPCTVASTDCLDLEILSCQQIIPIDANWSGISSFIVPENPGMNEVLNPVINELILLYNYNGIYWPDGGVYTLFSWDKYSGYAIKASDDTQLTISGLEVEDKTLNLSTGWNLMPVLSKQPFNIEDLFNGVNGFSIAKDVAGTGIYWDTFGINTIGFLQPGKAYYVRMTEAGSINFGIPADHSYPVKTADFIEFSTPWNAVLQTPVSHLVAFDMAESPFESGDVIGGFTSDGWCTGIAGVSDPNVVFAVSLNGDDPYSSAKDGFEPGSMMNYKLFRPSTAETFDVSVTYDPQWDHTGQFAVNGLSVITDVLFGASNINSMLQHDLKIYPNPTDGTFTIEGMDTKINVWIFNAFGEEVYLHEPTLPAEVDLSDRSKGIYFIRIDAGDRMYYEKLIIN